MNVAIIPARGGSRRIPRKNIRVFYGKPIITYSIEVAKASGLFKHIVVSIDDDEIATVAFNAGVEVLMRPEKLSNDDVGTQEVAAQAIQHMQRIRGQIDYACCIYPTVPLLRVDDLRSGFNVMRIIDDYAYVPGWFYWGRAEWFGDKPLKEPAPLVVEPERYVDINTLEDWAKAEEMYATLNMPAAIDAAFRSML